MFQIKLHIFEEFLQLKVLHVYPLCLTVFFSSANVNLSNLFIPIHRSVKSSAGLNSMLRVGCDVFIAWSMTGVV